MPKVKVTTGACLQHLSTCTWTQTHNHNNPHTHPHIFTPQTQTCLHILPTNIYKHRSPAKCKHTNRHKYHPHPLIKHTNTHIFLPTHIYLHTIHIIHLPPHPIYVTILLSAVRKRISHPHNVEAHYEQPAQSSVINILWVSKYYEYSTI